MWRFLFFFLFFVGFVVALDYYVYRNWRRYALTRQRTLGWTLPIYRVLLCIMPLVAPLYFLMSRWWEVDPKLPRMLVIGLWAFYYLPKFPIVAVLVAKDLVRIGQKVLARRRPEPVRVVQGMAAPDPEDDRKMTRAEFLRTAGWAAAVLPFGVVAKGALFSLYDFDVQRVTVPIRSLPRAFEGITIAQLSDIHAGSFFSPQPMRDTLALVRELQADMILITGDFVNHDVAEMPIILPSLKELKADLGVFGCLGNHDHYADVAVLESQIKTTPVDLLVNAHRTLTIGGAKLHLIGTDNTGFRQHYADLPRAMAGLKRDPNGEEVRILMAHDPTFWDSHVRTAYADIELMLGGHTHGGQIGFEFGPLRWGLAKLVYERWAGLYGEPAQNAAGRQYLYVNRGIGTVGPPLRIGIRPEITLLTLSRA